MCRKNAEHLSQNWTLENLMNPIEGGVFILNKYHLTKIQPTMIDECIWLAADEGAVFVMNCSMNVNERN